jgi:acylphosphatase
MEGHVQGVGFRWWTQAVAQELGIHGWVRNRLDGSVEVHAGGAAGDMTVFEERLRVGPSSGRVDRVTSFGLAAEVLPLDFEIR